MTHQVVRRATYLIPSGPKEDPDRMHLFVVMCEPRHHDVLLVPISTYREGVRGHDSTCLLDASEHSFLKHQSYVKYEYAQLTQIREVEQKVASRFWIAKECISEKCYQRILAGFHSSLFVRSSMLDYLPDPNPLY